MDEEGQFGQAVSAAEEAALQWQALGLATDSVVQTDLDFRMSVNRCLLLLLAVSPCQELQTKCHYRVSSRELLTISVNLVSVSCVPCSDGLNGSLVFSNALISEAGAQRMAQHFSNLLAAVVAAPQQPVSQLQLMGPAELDLTVRTFNATDTPLSTSTVHGLFEATAAAQPKDRCLISMASELSYMQVGSCRCPADIPYSSTLQSVATASYASEDTSQSYHPCCARLTSGPISWRTI